MHSKPLLLIILLCSLALVLFLASRPVEDQGGYPSLSRSGLDLRRLDQKLEPVNRAIAETRLTGLSQPVLLQISEPEMFSKFGDWSEPGLALLGISDGEAYLADGGIDFRGRLHMLGIGFEYSVKTRLRIEDEDREASIDSARLGALAAPGWLRELVVEAIKATVDAGLPRIPIETRTLIISDQEMVISGVTRGL